jgi:hypothetical protein
LSTDEIGEMRLNLGYVVLNKQEKLKSLSSEKSKKEPNMKSKIVVVVAFTMVTLMVSMSVVTFESGNALVTTNGTASNSKDQNISDPDGGKTNLMQNPHWNDSKASCKTTFSCNFMAPDGWDDKQSIQLSTQNNTYQTWSWIFSKDVDVSPNSVYELVTHMKMNDWTTQSHVAMQAFNESSKEWYQILQCPSGINGLLAWQEFRCSIKIPQGASKISLVLNAGWSSRQGEPAVTLFDAIQLFRIS